MSSFEIPEPIIKLELNGTNFGQWAFVTRVSLQARGLWGHITSESPCPPAPVPPPQPPATAPKEVTDASNKAYQSALDAYRQWDIDDARAMLILIHSVEADIVGLQLQSAKQMWDHLRQRYRPLVYSLLKQLQELKQGDDSVEAFFHRFMAIQCNLDALLSLSDVCRECACCMKHRQHNEIRRLYEFLVRLRAEFEPTKARLLSRSPLPDMIDAFNVLRDEEIRLRSMPKNALLPTPPVTPHALEDQCSYCGKFGHTFQNCFKRKKKNRRGGRSKMRSEPSSLPQNEVSQLANLLQGLNR